MSVVGKKTASTTGMLSLFDIVAELTRCNSLSLNAIFAVIVSFAGIILGVAGTRELENPRRTDVFGSEVIQA